VEASETAASAAPPAAAAGPTAAAAEPRSMWARIRRDAVLLGAGNVALIVTQLGFRGILVATLLPSAYGRLSLVLSIYNSAWIIGSSGLPNSVARYIALADDADDAAIVGAALRAGAGPIAIATAIVAAGSWLVLESPLAALIGAVGFLGLIYSLLMAGVLRGRQRMVPAAAVMPIAGLAELGLLAALWRSGPAVTPMSAFAVFAAGNVVGLVAGIAFVRRTSPSRRAELPRGAGRAPRARELLAFSLWLGLATGSIAILSLAVRAAATLESFAVVAVIDVALILFSIPQRLGIVIVLATTPHASRQVGEGKFEVMISRREHLVVIAPFVLAAAAVAFTPLVGWVFGLIGRPEYDASARYLALALLAGPARILYGLVEGVLIAHHEGRFLAVTAIAITALACAAIFAAAAAGQMTVAFLVFVAAFWLIYLRGLLRVTRVTAERSAQA